MNLNDSELDSDYEWQTVHNGRIPTDTNSNSEINCINDYNILTNILRPDKQKNQKYPLLNYFTGFYENPHKKSKIRIQLILNSGSISTNIMFNWCQNLNVKINTAKWKNQDEYLTTTKEVNVYFCLPEFSATKIVTWKCHVNDYIESRYDMILGRDILIVPWLDIKFYEKIMDGGERKYEGCAAPMINLIKYDLNFIIYKKINPEE